MACVESRCLLLTSHGNIFGRTDCSRGWRLRWAAALETQSLQRINVPNKQRWEVLHADITSENFRFRIAQAHLTVEQSCRTAVRSALASPSFSYTQGIAANLHTRVG